MNPGSPLRTLFDGAIDYAGLFPPAQLSMPVAVANYGRYLASPDHWALGRFIVPVARLDELSRALPPAHAGPAWRLSAIGTSDPAADAAAIAAFNRAHESRAQVDAIEAATPTSAAVAARVPAISGLAVFCELDPASLDFAATSQAVRDAGASAKLRTGGVRPSAFPPASAVAAFLLRCRQLALPFKATAGLHHPIRGAFPLTYEPSASAAVMHGFLNLALTAASAASGANEAELVEILECTDPTTLAIEPDGILWRGWSWSQGQLAASRRFFLGFGSCSFDEPLLWLNRCP